MNETKKMLEGLNLKEPFADYTDFDDCVSKNSDKGDPEAYCAVVKRKVEGEKAKTDLINAYKEECRRKKKK